MEVREIEAKTLLATVRDPDGWFGVRYNMNLYRGCEHRCIYCDSRSECYQIERFDEELLVKANAVELLGRELARKRIRGTVGTGAMTDPYTPSEARLRLTRQCLELISRARFPVHLTTKSDMVLRDLDVLSAINRDGASVAFTLTTTDDSLARKVEPRAPSPSARLRAMRALADEGILVGVLMMPLLPFIQDTRENVEAIVDRAKEAGATFIVPWYGMSLRDRQREHYYRHLDVHFPGLRARYEARYGTRYGCQSPQARYLSHLFEERCASLGLLTDPRQVAAHRRPKQLSLF
ncbi:MAG TPA: radical SAM protein [Armatimonadota bacterium]|jgi:DNA repair photolyase